MPELLRLPPAQLAAVDIGRMNLLCAEGLPGAEDLDVEIYVQRLDAWAQRIGRATDANLHVFRDRAAEFENSEPLWRMLVLTRWLSNEQRVQYNATQKDPDDWDWSDSRDQFIHGALGAKRSGTCSSLPVLVIALGRRLGYPLRLVHSPGHCFCRWDTEDHEIPAWRRRFNIEYNGEGMDSRSDESYYKLPRPWPPLELKAERHRPIKLHLRSLSFQEELACALSQRAWTLQWVKRLPEAWDAMTAALRYAPHNDSYAFWCRDIHKQALETALKPYGLTAGRYCELLEQRLRGAAHVFPWERLGQPARRPGPVHPIQDPIAAAELAVAARVVSQIAPLLRPSLRPLPVPLTSLVPPPALASSAQPSASPLPAHTAPQLPPLQLPGLAHILPNLTHINGRKII